MLSFDSLLLPAPHSKWHYCGSDFFATKESKIKRDTRVQARMGWLIVLGLLSSCTSRDTPHAEVASLNARDGSQNSVTEPRFQPKFASAIRSLLHDSKRNYWFGSDKEGVGVFDGESYSYFSVNEGLPDNQIRSIQEGHDGTLWFGTASGVASYDGQTIVNRTLDIALQAGDPVPSEWGKGDQDLWFSGGRNQGVYRYDGQSLHYLAFPTIKVGNAGQLNVTTDITVGGSGRAWIATYSGVYGYDGNVFTTIDNVTTGLIREFGELHIRSILEDSKGRLWIGNNGLGVLLFVEGTTTQFSKEMGLVAFGSQRTGGPSPQGTLEHVFCIEEDRLGNIWFGDRDTGAWRYDGQSIVNFPIQGEFQSHSIWDIHLDDNGELWFAMDKGKVAQFNGTSLQVLPPLASDSEQGLQSQ